MQPKAGTFDACLAALESHRRATFEALRNVIRANLDKDCAADTTLTRVAPAH